MFGNSYYYRKLHSLLGVVPIGFFLIEHLMTNYSAFNGGKQEFTDTVAWIHNLPFLLILEIVFIWLPLAYHGLYGLYVAYTAKNNPNQYSYYRNWMFFLQRVSGVVTFVFIVWHFSQTRLQVALGNVDPNLLAEHMHTIAINPLFMALYIVGIVSTVFHFCNGMWYFLSHWGVTIGPRAQRISSVIWMIAFVLISVIGILAFTAFTNDSFA